MCWACLQPDHLDLPRSGGATIAAAGSTVRDETALLAVLENPANSWAAFADRGAQPVIVSYSFAEGDTLPDPADDPYGVLAIAHDASDGEVRAAWKAALSEAHPDRARARGLPSEFIEVAEAKSAALNAAFDDIMRERRAMALEGVA